MTICVMAHGHDQSIFVLLSTATYENWTFKLHYIVVVKKKRTYDLWNAHKEKVFWYSSNSSQSTCVSTVLPIQLKNGSSVWVVIQKVT